MHTQTNPSKSYTFPSHAELRTPSRNCIFPPHRVKGVENTSPIIRSLNSVRSLLAQASLTTLLAPWKVEDRDQEERVAKE